MRARHWLLVVLAAMMSFDGLLVPLLLGLGGRRANRTLMLFPQATAHRTLTGFRTPLTVKFTHNNGAGIEMLHRGTSSCNSSATQQWVRDVPLIARLGQHVILS